MSLFQAVWIGLWEVTSAVFPGVSRSMSTIAAGQSVGMTRTAALEFSFLLSIPVMIAATGYEFFRTVHPKNVPGGEAMVPLVMTAHGWVVLAIGFVVSFVVALGVVEWFLLWVRRHGFVVFAIYRIILGWLSAPNLRGPDHPFFQSGFTVDVDRSERRFRGFLQESHTSRSP
jgi:undecaprenyl-diphosphatase